MWKLITIAVPFVLFGCALKTQNEEKKKGAGDATHGNYFAEKGTLCGSHLVLEQPAGGKTQLSLSLAVCGQPDPTNPDTQWMALAASHTADDGFVVDAQGNVAQKRADGSLAPIGKVDVVEDQAPITLAPGVAAALQVDGEPFDLKKHDKSSKGQALLLNLP